MRSFEKVISNFSDVSACGGRFSFCRTEKGFQTQESFEGYVKNILIPELDQRAIIRNERHRIFLLLDNHKSHSSFDFCQWCANNYIELITFYPNSTRILQMCDVSMFSAAKSSWKKIINNWRSEEGNKILNEVEVVKLLAKVNNEFIKRESILNGFRATGIHPFNVENVMFSRCYGSNSQNLHPEIDDAQSLHPEINDSESSNPEINDAQSSHPEIIDAQSSHPEINDAQMFEAQISYPEMFEAQISYPEIFDVQNPVTETVQAQEIADVLSMIKGHLQKTVLPYVTEKHQNLAQLVTALETQLSYISSMIAPDVIHTPDGIHSPDVVHTPDSSVALASPPSALKPTENFDFSNILKSPKNYKRVGTQRNYKLKNFGVMCDKNILKKIQDGKEKLVQEEIIKQTIRNIKKENVQKRKAELSTKRTQREFEKQQKDLKKQQKDLEKQQKRHQIDTSDHGKQSTRKKRLCRLNHLSKE